MTSKRKNKAEIYKDKKGEFRWRLLGLNGKIIDAATEGFKKRSSCVNNLNKIAKAFTNFEIFDQKPAAKKTKAKKPSSPTARKSPKVKAKKPAKTKKTTRRPALRAIPGGKKNGKAA